MDILSTHSFAQPLALGGTQILGGKGSVIRLEAPQERWKGWGAAWQLLRLDLSFGMGKGHVPYDLPSPY